MGIVPWTPWSLVRDTGDLTPDLADLFWPWQRQSELFEYERTFLPATDVLVKDKDILIRMEIPGLDPEENLDIKVQDNMLVISGERSEETETKREDYYLRERRYGTFTRRFPLPEGFDADKIQARYDDGVLEVTLPGAAQLMQPQPKRIEIKKGRSKAKQIKSKSKSD